MSPDGIPRRLGMYTSPTIHCTPAPSPPFCSSLIYFLLSSSSFAPFNSGATAKLLDFRAKVIDATWMCRDGDPKAPWRMKRLYATFNVNASGNNPSFNSVQLLSLQSSPFSFQSLQTCLAQSPLRSESLPVLILSNRRSSSATAKCV
ncbi:hypothetical protein BDQ12DRAFT_243974 [Crucibulum laeve]|uniref:Uncharacterized protein n=1 Tax=Crucibulum laeve TaxID=68775 RepID=A0A5C3LTW5_9AGAR|nr:hypothetical protein BDQ12DRAFT_243974 [Crucibulum laeve]